MSERIRVIIYGLGVIGRSAAKLVTERAGMELVGAVDCSPTFAGRDAGEVLELGRQLGFNVTDTLAETLAETEADAVIHCTGSSFAGVLPQLREIVAANLCCVTSCEEALFPRYRYPDLAEELNTLCVSHGVGVLGTGVNPGFVMDTLATVSTAVCQRVESVKVLRVVDAGTRREALQRKVGAGMVKEDFEKLVVAGQMGHAGLLESLAFVVAALGWPGAKLDEKVEPVLTTRAIRTKYVSLLPGQVAGVRQVARAELAGKEVARLELQMYVGADQPRDEIEIAGVPPVKLVVTGGTPGDLATPAILVNMVPALLTAGPGLHTMATLTLPRIAR